MPLRDTGTVAVVAAVVGSRQEAELIVGMLRSHGIRAAVSADDAGGVDVALQAQGVRVLVPDGDMSAARRLLQTEPPPRREPNRVQRLLIRLLGGSAKG
jgi:type III secretory pathway lipoprotein EscJ